MIVDQHGAELRAPEQPEPEGYQQACVIRGAYPHANGCTIELEADEALVGEFTVPGVPPWAEVGQLVVLALIPAEEV